MIVPDGLNKKLKHTIRKMAEELSGYALVSKLKRTRRKINLTATEQALYHELVDICNESDWSEVFACSNDELRTALCISEPTLIASRLSLINAKLIFYKSGKSKRKFGEYSFLIPLSTKDSLGDALVNPLGDALVNPLANPLDYNKHKGKTKPKPNSEGKPSAPLPSSKKKKKEIGETVEFWPALVAVWFEFYKKNPGKGEEPTFEGQSPASLKKIVERLKKRSEAKNIQWSENTSCDTLAKFLTYAYGLNWLKDNFLLQNLERQYDKIVNQSNETRTSKNSAPDLSDHKRELARKMGIDPGKG
jgi:hypothetical protein